MKFTLLSVILCYLSASRLLSRISTRSRALTRPSGILQRRTFTTPVQSRHFLRNSTQFRRVILAAGALAAFEGHECFKMFADHIDPGVKIPSPSIPLEPKEERNELARVLNRCDDLDKGDCFTVIYKSDLSVENKKQLLDYFRDRVYYP